MAREALRRRLRNLLALVVGLAVALPLLFQAAGPAPAQAQQAAFTLCPPAGGWALAAWRGGNNTPLSQAAATCSPTVIDVAFAWDYGAQEWRWWFAIAEGASTLTAVSNLQALFLHGGEAAPAP